MPYEHQLHSSPLFLHSVAIPLAGNPASMILQLHAGQAHLPVPSFIDDMEVEHFLVQLEAHSMLLSRPWWLWWLWGPSIPQSLLKLRWT
eukprot:11665296-Prorocentrum_lima.AAC.1